MDELNVNNSVFRLCCGKELCPACDKKVADSCPLCRTARPKDDDEILASLRRHAGNENPAAMRLLGNAYTSGHHGLAKDAMVSALLFERAANSGDVRAMSSLGVRYHEGKGFKRDAQKAVKYYRIAVDRGNMSAQYHLGHCFRDGVGVTRDYAKAFRLYKLSADQGYTKAQVSLGARYEFGQGVTRDLTVAKLWYERAAAKGNKQAKTHLVHLQRKIEKQLAPDVAAVRRELARLAAAGHDKASAALAQLGPRPSIGDRAE